MSTIVYQGFFEPQPAETTTLRLKLAAPKPIDFENDSNREALRDDRVTEKSDSGGWNFVQSLSNFSTNKSLDNDTFYPALRLSQKSLELCTENLGSETGSDDASDIDILSFAKSTTTTATTTTTRRVQGHVKKSFPPPLTTIRGSNSIQVRPHREGGRLIIEAVEAPCNRTCFEAERSNGRLQLKFLKNCEFFYDQKLSSEDDEDNNIAESETNGDDSNETERVFGDDEFEKNDADKYGGYVKKDMDGNRKDGEGEMGTEKYRRRNRRCNESGHGNNNNNKGLCYREAFWVAT